MAKQLELEFNEKSETLKQLDKRKFQNLETWFSD